MPRLTNKNGGSQQVISNRLDVPFVLCFKYKLENGYTFAEMKHEHLQQLQRFLDHLSQMTFQQVDKVYRRNSDPSDIFNNQQVIHYGKNNDKFRIHGVIENGQFVVLRLDPMHKFHK